MATVYDKIQQEKTKWGTHKNIFDDFRVGDKVKVITPAQDCYFFWGEKGTVISNSGKYLGIRVEFDKPRKFEDGYVQKDFNFEPSDLFRLTIRP